VTSPLDPALARALREAPKVELHLHLDGAMSLPWLLERIRRRPDPAVRTLAGLRSRLRYRSFAEFIERWVWKCGFLDRYADFESLAESVLGDLAGQGVVHVEPSFSPGDYERHGLETPGLVEAVLRGANRASRETGIGFGLVIDLIRDHGPAVAARRLAAVSPYRGEGVVAVGLGGSEPAYPAPLFAEVFAEAARLGFHRTAHAGEAAGPGSGRSGRRWTPSAWSGSATASARSRMPPSSRGSRGRACRSRSARPPTSGRGWCGATPDTPCRDSSPPGCA